jgi:putative acetyltransferase
LWQLLFLYTRPAQEDITVVRFSLFSDSYKSQIRKGEAMKLEIRPERTEDIDAISEINRRAFESEDEPNLIVAIRKSEHFIPELSLVAELDGDPVGHILFSRISIDAGDRIFPVLSLAPMAVLPAHQRQGIGTALVQRGLEECRRLNHNVIVVIGHAEYYPRFGFVQARDHGLEVEYDVPSEAFMVLELESGALQGIGGIVRFPAAFDAAM